MSLFDHLQFRLRRLQGQVRRGLTSLRMRGWRATWQRVRLELQPPRRLQRTLLYRPDSPGTPAQVPCDPSPQASIVIPVHGQIAHTLQCLRALADHPPQATCEVIVVDDASPDDTLQRLQGIDGLRVHARSRNGGFIAACNDGAALARGATLVFLNNDTIPQPGWLDALLQTFRQHPEAGIVGAQLLYPDGRLQEAGGLVFSDGSASNRGRFHSPDAPPFTHLRTVDYVSGAALAIPAALFRQLGGFDARYAPAYYEDTDLAFAIRAAGYRVLYQPAARVIHDEGATAGTDTGSGVKACQRRNQHVFAEKWADALARQPAPSIQPASARRILVIDGSTPRPDRDSASVRLVEVITLMQQLGWEVVFLPVDLAHAGAATEALQQLGVECWHAPFVGQPAAWLREHGRGFRAAWVCRYHIAHDVLPLLRRHAPDATVVFDSIDLHFLRELRAAEVHGDGPALQQAERTRRRELAVFRQADAGVVVSAAERDRLQHDAPDIAVTLISNIHRPAQRIAALPSRRGVLFVGGFRHPPNVDAVRWFVSEVWPRVRIGSPDAVFHCVGADVPEAVRVLGGSPGVRIHGYVPDLQPLLDSCRVSVAPLRFGAGVKGKINQSMANGLPVVATGCAAEGMDLHDGRDVLLADTADAFAGAVLRLLHDDALWQALSTAGLANVQRCFSPDVARRQLQRLLP
ncbi:MAG: glycosyl transferase [Pseudoxanthomonas suwonensis]|nr:MAG: glycosyl transferase [Pseudoxanthomonas suwonensis]